MNKYAIAFAAAAGITTGAAFAHEGPHLKGGIDMISVDLSCTDENGDSDHYALRVFPLTHNEASGLVSAEFGFVSEGRISPFSSLSPQGFDGGAQTHSFNVTAWDLEDESPEPFYENYMVLSLSDQAYTAQFDITYPTINDLEPTRTVSVTCDIPDMGLN